MEPVAYTYHADVYCAVCGADLPDVDPEGNERHPVFAVDAYADHPVHCGECGDLIERYGLTDHGVAYTVNTIADAAERRDLTDTVQDWAWWLTDSGHYSRLTHGQRALLSAVAEADVEAAYVIARYYLDWSGDDLHYVPDVLRAYWPY